jgi:hypothetical protein
MKADALDYCLEEAHERDRWARALDLDGRGEDVPVSRDRQERELDHDDEWTP